MSRLTSFWVRGKSQEIGSPGAGLESSALFQFPVISESLEAWEEKRTSLEEIANWRSRKKSEGNNKDDQACLCRCVRHLAVFRLGLCGCRTWKRF